VDHLVGKDFAGGHVVAVAETAGDDQELIVPQRLGLFHQAEDVHALGPKAGLLERELRLAIAIRSRRSKH